MMLLRRLRLPFRGAGLVVVLAASGCAEGTENAMGPAQVPGGIAEDPTTPPPMDAAGPPMDRTVAMPAAPVGDSAGPPMDAAAAQPMDGAAGAPGMMPMPGGEMPMPMDDGTCCPDGDCLCHGPDPTGLTSSEGPYAVDSYDLAGAGCVYYPTDAEPPFAAVTVSDGFVGTGGCGFAQTSEWGPLYASWGIVAMIIDTGGGDQPPTRGSKLGAGVEAFKAENENSSSPLYQKLAGRYGTSGFSMGGGGTTYASEDDPSLLTSVAIMPWGPTRGSVTVPTLVICGASDGIASCGSHGTPYYGRLDGSVSKMRVTVSGGHNGQPSAGRGVSGEYGLAFQKAFLEGDERWRPLLVSGDADETNIQ